VLGRIADRDPDPETRERAADRLMLLASQVASDAPDAPTADVALQAAHAISDPRRLSTLAKGQAIDAVRQFALSQIQDARALGSIARHAKHESTALAALDRVADQGELLEITLHSDHRDVAL